MNALLIFAFCILTALSAHAFSDLGALQLSAAELAQVCFVALLAILVLRCSRLHWARVPSRLQSLGLPILALGVTLLCTRRVTWSMMSLVLVLAWLGAEMARGKTGNISARLWATALFLVQVLLVSMLTPDGWALKCGAVATLAVYGVMLFRPQKLSIPSWLATYSCLLSLGMVLDRSVHLLR